MAPLTQDEQTALAKQVLQQLSTTPYACSSLDQLSGGTANFLYRGTLLKPLAPQHHDDQPAKTVVVKRSTDFVAINRDFPLDITRCVFEESTLRVLANAASFAPASGNVVVKAPCLYLFDQESHTQVLEDFPDTTDLTTILESSDVNTILPGSSALSVGRALGTWLRSFHDWASAPGQAALQEVGSNMGMRKLKCLITYDSFIEILERHPELLDGCRKPLEEVRDAMKTEFERDPVPDENRGLIHGDFWAGNVLLKNVPWREAAREDEGPNELFIIDWENTQFGHRAVDIGGMLADIYERNHFKGVQASIPMMQGFMSGYGSLGDDLAFTTAIHAGVHLICWYYRRDRNAPLPYPLERVLAALTLGRDFVLKGWARDRQWFKTSMLAPLFAGEASNVAA
ncbi:hypothetical protein J3458_019990 [Metarhizium acridum]|uniref:Aminoglycoside phosphotransferase domain-containing protein n=1 Tax=Metarhizium acridum (strain CQMa 102) TaxID=655827 RepID=E9EIF8_METAQ|nr:uncharacterized protein MAC_09656 [Metarhizium acridum CQMa 102]EFY84305.1 hypothetical protein MAC_09656 [Metarhizium acridum CQMa 102]KAG8408983.1 hypothetical protein J3458_019990 [Metarhizium acridum]